jgi:hypothetical protein
MRTRRALTPLAAWLATATVAFAPAPTLAAGPSFSLAPIRLDVEATPGRPYTDALEVANEAREPARIKVYLEDWRLERDGAVTFARAGSWPRSASTWIRVNPAEFELPALQTVDVRFTVTVPRGAPAGGYRAAIVVEQVPRPSPGNADKREVGIRARIASVIYVRVGDPVPDAALRDVTFRREPNGLRSIVLAVENRGGVHFRTAGQVTLADPRTGKVVHRLDVPDVPLLPESARDVRLDVPQKVKPGDYQVRAELEVGRKEVYVHEGSISID